LSRKTNTCTKTPSQTTVTIKNKITLLLWILLESLTAVTLEFKYLQNRKKCRKSMQGKIQIGATFRPDLMPTQQSGTLTSGAKLPEREAENSPPSSAKVKN
jgi:hypothetical protein